MAKGEGSTGITKQSGLSSKNFSLSTFTRCKMKTNLLIQEISAWNVQFERRNTIQWEWDKNIIRQRNKRQYTCFRGANTDIITPYAPQAVKAC